MTYRPTTDGRGHASVNHATRPLFRDRHETRLRHYAFPANAPRSRSMTNWAKVKAK